MGLKLQAIVLSLMLLSLTGLLFAGVADSASSKTWVVVNSANFQDAIGGAVYAYGKGYQYAFVLTPSQGDYLFTFLKSSASPVWYYESSNPVSSTLGQNFKALGKSSIKVTINSDLAGWFASQAPKKSAIVVGSSDGAEAVSISSYALASGSGLYFADPSNVASMVSNLISKGDSVMVYGSVASGYSPPSGVQVINSGSKYADNLQALSMYWAMAPKTNQVLFLSGKTFEKSVPQYPVALVGRTEVSPDLLSWLKSNGVTRGIALQGDDIKGAIASVKADSGLTVFVNLLEGFPGDAEVQPLAVLALPGPNVVLSVSGAKYDEATKTFSVSVANQGNVPAYVKVAISLPNGQTASSISATIPTGSSSQVSVPLNAAPYIGGGQIAKATFSVYSGSQASWMDAIDAVNITAIPVIAAPKPTPRPAPSVAVPPAPVAPAPAKPVSSGIDPMLIALVLVIVLVGGYLFMQKKK